MNFRIVNDLINQSQNGKYGDTSGIGQLIHQVSIVYSSLSKHIDFIFKMSNLQGSQEEYVDYCNIPLPPKQKYASFDAPVGYLCIHDIEVDLYSRSLKLFK
jgi:hypothetical protein